MNFRIITLDTIPSTNTALKDWARGEGILASRGPLEPWTVLRAASQTGGRGRQGRVFVSPPGGLYMSLYLPGDAVKNPAELTPRLCAAVYLALKGLTGADFMIKWVNDLYLNGKKIVGILCEGVQAGYVCGIGVNLVTPPGGFPPEAGPAGALDGYRAEPEELQSRILERVPAALEESFAPKALRLYRERNFLLGRNVIWLDWGRRVPCRVTGIGDDFSLTAADGAGRSLSVRTGETVIGEDRR